MTAEQKKQTQETRDLIIKNLWRILSDDSASNAERLEAIRLMMEITKKPY